MKRLELTRPQMTEALIQVRASSASVLLLCLITACGGTHRPREQELQAVRLLGSASTVAAKPKVDAECPQSEGNSTQSAVARAMVEWIGEEKPGLNIGGVTIPSTDLGPNLADGLHATATKMSALARPCRKMQATISTSAHPDISEIRAILGQEDSSGDFTVELDDERVPMTAHTYGWLEFVAMRGKVLMLKVDFKTSGLY